MISKCLQRKHTEERHGKQRRQPREGRARDQSYAHTSKALGLWKLEEARENSPLEQLKGAQACWHLGFKLLASRTLREYTDTCLSHHTYSGLLGQPRDTDAISENMPSTVASRSPPALPFSWHFSRLDPFSSFLDYFLSHLEYKF